MTCWIQEVFQKTNTRRTCMFTTRVLFNAGGATPQVIWREPIFSKCLAKNAQLQELGRKPAARLRCSCIFPSHFRVPWWFECTPAELEQANPVQGIVLNSDPYMQNPANKIMPRKMVGSRQHAVVTKVFSKLVVSTEWKVIRKVLYSWWRFSHKLTKPYRRTNADPWSTLSSSSDSHRTAIYRP